MNSLSEKLFCEVEFRDFVSGDKISIAGKIDIDKLISPNFKNIIIENYSFENYHWKQVESRVSKVDVIKITAYKAQVFLTYEKGDLIVESEPELSNTIEMLTN